MMRKHRLLERFLYDVLGIDKGSVHDQACKLEHPLSDEAEEALCRFLDHPTQCPDDHRPIPPCRHNVRNCEKCGTEGGRLVPLTALQSGKKGRIRFIGGAKRAHRRLRDMGIIPNRMDRFTTHPVLGYMILISVVLISFFLIFTLGDFVSEWVMAAFEWSGGHASDLLGEGWLYMILWNGAAQGLVAAIAFVLPYILPFYFLLAIPEDSGYLARVAILMDALMHRFGLHGKFCSK